MKDKKLILHCSDGPVVRVSASVDESGQVNDFKMVIHSFLAWRSALKGQCREKTGKFTVVLLGKALSGIAPSCCGRQMAGNS